MGRKNIVFFFLDIFYLEAIAEQTDKQFSHTLGSGPKRRSGHYRWLLVSTFPSLERGAQGGFSEVVGQLSNAEGHGKAQRFGGTAERGCCGPEREVHRTQAGNMHEWRGAGLGKDERE